VQLLRGRQLAAQRSAESVGDSALAAEIQGALDQPREEFEAAPAPTTGAGKMARKRARKGAYKLAY
jgi:hypothetical protein